MSKKNLIIITQNKYPNGDAGAIRQHSFAKLFMELGYSVKMLGYGEYTGNVMKDYEGVSYTSARTKGSSVISKIAGRLLFGSRVKRFLNTEGKDASYILVIDTFPYIFKIIRKHAFKTNAILLHDSVEWYSPEEFPKGEKDFFYKLKEKTNLEIINKDWRVVAISSYLQEHFSKTADKTVRIPVIMDVDSIKYRTSLPTNSNKTVFVYAGAPARKDYLKEIVEAFSMLNPQQLSRVELHIVGATEKQLIEICGVSEEKISTLGDSLVAHGRLPHSEAVKWVVDADYTLLLRDESLRYAKAGFPTKIVESLSCGTPPICNLSSDLGMYLENRKNSFVFEGHDPKALKIAIESALSLSAAEKEEMRNAARQTAEKNFDYKLYGSTLEELLK